jgi:hypothetical protein
MAAAPSVAERLTRLTQNPVARRAALTALIGAGAGGSAAAYGTGPDAQSEGLRGALAGGVLGAGMGLVSPAIRAGNARKAFDKSIETTSGVLGAGKALSSEAMSGLSFLNNRKIKAINAELKNIDNLTSAEAELRKIHAAGNPSPQDVQRLATEIQDALKNLQSSGVSTIPEAKARAGTLTKELAALNQKGSKINQVGKTTDFALNKASWLNDYRKKRGVKYDLKELAKMDKGDVLVLPGLTGLVAGGLGFGLSEDAREQQIYRKAKEGK